MQQALILPSLSRRGPSPPGGGAAPVALLVLATLSLGILQLAPRAALPVMLIFPPGIDADGAVLRVLAVPGWDLVSVRRLGPVTSAIAAPAVPEASAAVLRREAGAWTGLLAVGRGACLGWTATPTPDRGRQRGAAG